MAFIRSMPLNRDARSSKMIAEYQRRGFAVASIVWSRGESLSSNDGYAAVFKDGGGYGRRLRNLGVRIKWITFVASYIWQNRKEIDIIHSVDLDVGIISVPVGKILGIPVIYDAFDQMASFFAPSIFTKLLAILERWAIMGSKVAIFPDPIRLEQYGIASNDRIQIISNIPELENANLKQKSALSAREAPLPNHVVHLVYVGTLEENHRALEVIPRICDRLHGKVIFSVGGVGFLEEFFFEQSKLKSNLNFAGKLPYDEALSLMATAHCLFGPYLLTTPAHRYAVPNKMYEHLALGKPLLTNDGTPVSDLVRREHSGFLFDGTEEDLVSAIEKLTPEECRRVGDKAAQAWQRSYSVMRSFQLQQYFSALDQISRRA